MSRRLAGKVALVFGAGSIAEEMGNGKAAAILYAREGARVVAVDRELDRAQATVDAIRAEGHDACAIAADATASEAVADAVLACERRFGRIDVLHNNVGDVVFGGPIAVSADDWERGLRLNLTTAFLSCKHVLPVMERQASGAIVNVSSIAGLRWLGLSYVAYASAKAGLNQLTTSIALEYAHRGIRANAVAPGLIDSGMVRVAFRAEAVRRGIGLEDLMAERHAASPTGRMGDPWDVAYASLFLASDEARYVNGVVLPVDGGMVQRCG